MRNTELLDLLHEEADQTIFKRSRWMTVEEGYALFLLLQLYDIRTYIECGTANGYSALWAAAALEGVEGAEIHTWDIVDRPKVWHSVEALKPLGAAVQFHLRPFDDWPRMVTPKGPTLFFVDGGHKWREVLADWKTIEGRAKPGDVIVFHDAGTCEGVLGLVRELLGTYRGTMIRTRNGLGVVFA